jgi:hypothetical protein
MVLREVRANVWLRRILERLCTTAGRSKDARAKVIERAITEGIMRS